MKVYIHIGAHKTGTTYIQKMCSEQKTILSSKGILYLKTGRKYFGHHDLMDVVRGESSCEETRLLIAEELKGNYKAVLISSENFEDLNEEEIKLLLSLFGECDFEILYFFRNWSPLLHSMWQENVKHGATHNFHMFVSEHIGSPTDSKILNFALPLREYAKIVGLGNLHVASYDLVCETGDLFDYLVSFIGIDSSIEHKCEKVNAGLSAPVIECIRALNCIAIASGYKPSCIVRQSFLDKVLSSAVPDYLNKLFSIMNLYMVTLPDYGQSFVARNLSKEFLSEFEDRIFHDLKKCRYSLSHPSDGLYVIDSNYLLEPEARELTFECWREIEKDLL
jgi:hypothetical protein